MQDESVGRPPGGGYNNPTSGGKKLLIAKASLVFVVSDRGVPLVSNRKRELQKTKVRSPGSAISEWKFGRRGNSIFQAPQTTSNCCCGGERAIRQQKSGPRPCSVSRMSFGGSVLVADDEGPNQRNAVNRGGPTSKGGPYWGWKFSAGRKRPVCTEEKGVDRGGWSSKTPAGQNCRRGRRFQAKKEPKLNYYRGHRKKNRVKIDYQSQSSERTTTVQIRGWCQKGGKETEEGKKIPSPRGPKSLPEHGEGVDLTQTQKRLSARLPQKRMELPETEEGALPSERTLKERGKKK